MTLPSQIHVLVPAPVDDSAWIAHHTPQPRAQLRLFCLPHAGGSASLFRGWASELASDVEVCPLQLPGREGRIKEPPFEEIGSLVRALADVLARRMDKPYALFGHSMGALVSFELTRELRRRGLPEPLHLFVASYVAPHIVTRPEPRTGEREEATVRRMADALPLPAGVAHELLGVMRRTLLADTAICEGYDYVEEEPLACPLSAFRGFDDYVLESQMEAWRALTRGPFSTRSFLGDHFFLRGTPRGLLQTIYRNLAWAVAARPDARHGPWGHRGGGGPNGTRRER